MLPFSRGIRSSESAVKLTKLGDVINEFTKNLNTTKRENLSFYTLKACHNFVYTVYTSYYLLLQYDPSPFRHLRILILRA